MGVRTQFTIKPNISIHATQQSRLPNEIQSRSFLLFSFFFANLEWVRKIMQGVDKILNPRVHGVSRYFCGTFFFGYSASLFCSAHPFVLRVARGEGTEEGETNNVQLAPTIGCSPFS